MKTLIEAILGSVLATAWLFGIVLAKAGWATVFAITIPFYAWYLVVERIAQMYGGIP